MANWLLIETFAGSDEASIIAEGSAPRRMVPLRKSLGRGNALKDLEPAIRAAYASGRRVELPTTDGHRRVIADPLLSFKGRVHGVYAWTGLIDEEPPARDPAGAWYFNVTTDVIGGSDDLLDLYGEAPEHRKHERRTAEAFGRLITNADESQALAKLVQAQPGFTHQATWTVKRDDGDLRAVHFSGRAFAEQGPSGTEIVLRGISHDIGSAASTPSAPPPIILAQQVLAGLGEPGVHRAIVNLRTFRLLRWLDDPMPGIAWEYEATGGEHWIHPEDMSTAQELSDGLALPPGRSTGSLRFRTVDSRWQRINVTANLVTLDQHTTAALMSLRVPEH